MAVNKFGFPVEFADDVFGESSALADVLKAESGAAGARILIVADYNVVQRTAGLGAKIGRYVNARGIALAGSPVVMSGGEKIKADNLQSALKVVSAILEARLSRRDCVVAIGGGTVLDVAGYAAAQVRGGVRLVRIPTTPAAMMDAALARMAAVDSLTVKDALRVPSVPAAVLIDLKFAETVLDGVWRGGLGAAVRQAVAADGPLLKKLVQLAPAYRERSPEALAEVVRAVVVSRGKKGAPDLAGWVAARLEAMSGYKLPYGYAVSIGVCVEAAYAVEKGYLKPKDHEVVRCVLEQCGAMDGLVHSRHLLGQADKLLGGLDAWGLASETPGVTVSAGLGKIRTEEAPDLDAYRKVLQSFLSIPTAG